MLCLAERWFEEELIKDLVYINLGEGISACIMMNDRILQGARGYAGEIAMSIQEGGPRQLWNGDAWKHMAFGIGERAKAELPVISDDMC